MKLFHIATLAAFCYLVTGCKKDPIRAGFISPHWTCGDTTLNRELLPEPPPQGFDHINSYGSESVWRVVYDPSDSFVFYYMTKEATGQFYHLWRYDRRTDLKSHLDQGLLGNLVIHKNGWMAYDKMDLNIYKMKTNGDSLTRLTTGASYQHPRWTDDGRDLYILNNNHNKYPVYKLSSDGTPVDSLLNIYSFVHPAKNYIYYLKLVSHVFYLVQRNLKTNSEKNILTENENGGRGIDDFYTDEDNATLFWWGNSGVFATDLASLQTKKIIDNGYNSRNSMYAFRRSPINGSFIAVQDCLTVVNAHTLKSVYRVIEFNPDGNCRHKIFVP